MRIKFFSLLIFAMVVAAGIGVAAKMGTNSSSNSSPAFTLHYRVSRINSSGGHSPSQEIRYVSSNGDFRVVNTEADGRVREYFFEHGRGHFTVNHISKQLIQNKNVSPDKKISPPMDAKALSSHPQFLRTEEILGFTAYALRSMDEETGLPSADVYYAVELGSTPLKVVIYSNGSVAYNTEAIGITLGEPDPALVKGPDYPITK